MQRNYDLQRTLDRREQELRLAELQVRNLELESRYYQTEEYQELAVRQRLNLVNPGENELILPDNSEQARNNSVSGEAQRRTPEPEQPSNFTQWQDFFLGVNQRDVEADD